MKKYNISEATPKLCEIIRNVEKYNEEVIIYKRGKPVAIVKKIHQPTTNNNQL